MTHPPEDTTDHFLQVLRENLPSEQDESRVRRGLIEKGVVSISLWTPDVVQGAAGTFASRAAELGAEVASGAASGGAALSAGTGTAAVATSSAAVAAKVFVGAVVLSTAAVVAVPLDRPEPGQHAAPSPRSASTEPVAPSGLASADRAQHMEARGSVVEHVEVQRVEARRRVTEHVEAKRSLATDDSTETLGSIERRPVPSNADSAPSRASASSALSALAQMNAPSRALDSPLTEEAAILQRALVALNRGALDTAERELNLHEQRFLRGTLAFERENLESRLALASARPGLASADGAQAPGDGRPTLRASKIPESTPSLVRDSSFLQDSGPINRSDKP